ARELNDARLDDSGGPLGTVDGERRMAAGTDVAHHLPQGLAASPSGRASHDDVAVSREPGGDDFSVPGLRGHRHDPLMAMTLNRQEHTPVPEREEDRNTL